MAVTPQRTDLDMEEFRQLLLTMRADLTALHQEQRADMQEEARDVSENELSGMDLNNPADLAANFTDRDRDRAMDTNVLAELHEVDKALDRIDNGTYGICISTGKPIPVERLRDLPYASMTVEAAEEAVQ